MLDKAGSEGMNVASVRKRVGMPEEHYSALKTIMQLPQERIEELYSALDSTPRRMHINQFVSALSTKVTINRRDLDNIMDFILTMAAVFGEEDESDSTVVDFIRDFFMDELRRKSEYEEVKPADDNWEVFNARLSTSP